MSKYDVPTTDFAVAAREASGWASIGIAVTIAFVVAMLGLGVYYYEVIYPAQLTGERKADVQSVQNLAGQRQAISDMITDYNANNASVTRLQTEPQTANRDQQITNARGSMAADVQSAHTAADNLPDVTVLPADQQQFLSTHPRS